MKAPERTPAPVARGAEVVVHEDGRRPWAGQVGAVKWSNVSGWWAEVRTDEGTYVVAAGDVEERPSAAEGMTA